MKYPMSMYSDDDSAFKAKVNELFDGEGIKHITTLTHAMLLKGWLEQLKMELMKEFNLTKVIGLTC